MLVVTIAKQFTFDAAHNLPDLPEGHKCRRLHGHTYTVELEFTGPVQSTGEERGFLIDYQVIADAWQPLHEQLDHQFLNGVSSDLGVPSTEHLAAWIARRLADLPAFNARPVFGNCREDLTLLTQVTVRESSTTWCRVRVEDMRIANMCQKMPWAVIEGIRGALGFGAQYLGPS
jgi:6-pyruvoyltetrahydropterin/6-carboxytetrahydropterin synthase